MAQPHLIPVSSGAPTSSVETVTPELAQQWLGMNQHNRNLRRAMVDRYARDMESGHWQFTGEAIKFAADGTLLDGQHRLQAVVKAGVTLPMLVVRGLPRESQSVMDTGAKRTAGDALGLHGEKNVALLSAVAGLVLSDGDRINRSSTTAEIMAAIDAEPRLREIANDILPVLRITFLTRSVAAYAYWRLDKINAADAARFFDSLSSLVGLPEGSPILALHRRLSGSRDSSRGRKYRQETLACIFMAWNAWRRHEKRTIIKLAYSADGRLSVPDPE